MPPLPRPIGLLLLLLAFLAGCQSEPVIDCRLTMVAQMPLQVESHLLVVPVGINGKWVHLVVDSGAGGPPSAKPRRTGWAFRTIRTT